MIICFADPQICDNHLTDICYNNTRLVIYGHLPLEVGPDVHPNTQAAEGAARFTNVMHMWSHHNNCNRSGRQQGTTPVMHVVRPELPLRQLIKSYDRHSNKVRETHAVLYCTISSTHNK